MEEQSEMRNVPQINKDYVPQNDKERVPIHERVLPSKDYDTLLLKQREGRPDKSNGDDQECTFKPGFIASQRSKSRNVDDLLKWGDDKLFKLANMRLSKLKGTQHTYKPDIDKNSKKMAGKRRGNVEDRLMEAGKNVAAKRDKKLERYQKKMFRPRINLNSKRILDKMNDELYKKDNGATENLDFWEAVPIPTWNTKLTLGKTKKEKGSIDKPIFDSRSRFAGKDLEEAKAVERNLRTVMMKRSMNRSKSRRGRSKSGLSKRGKGTISPGKKKAAMDSKTVQFMDDYVSPYNKSMLASGLPLKAIMKKSKKMNKMGKSKKGKGGSKKKNRSLSGRRRSLSDFKGGKRRFNRSRSKSISYTGAQAKAIRNSFSNKDVGSRSGSRRRGVLTSAKKLRSHSQSERNFAPYCQKFDPKEFARKRRERLFNHRQWNNEIRRRNEQNNLKSVKKLIYSDLYDAKSQKRSKSRNYSIDSDVGKLRRNASRSQKKIKLGAPPNLYHPLNQDKEHRRRIEVGNDYMYQSIQENQNGDGEYQTDMDYGVKNVFNNIMLH